MKDIGAVVPNPNLLVVLFQYNPLSPPIVLVPVPKAICPVDIEREEEFNLLLKVVQSVDER